jgi:hypothetical protein
MAQYVFSPNFQAATVNGAPLQFKDVMAQYVFSPSFQAATVNGAPHS